jgi:hypothetical protein
MHASPYGLSLPIRTSIAENAAAFFNKVLPAQQPS